MPTCPHCGDEHGPTECRAALSIRLAEALASHQEDQGAIAILKLELADLRSQIIQRDLVRIHR